MNARILRVLLGGLTLAASGTYTFVYLYRWEWNRALMSAAIFIAAEVAVMGSLLSQRLKVIDRRLDAQEVAAPPSPPGRRGSTTSAARRLPPGRPSPG